MNNYPTSLNVIIQNLADFDYQIDQAIKDREWLIKRLEEMTDIEDFEHITLSQKLIAIKIQNSIEKIISHLVDCKTNLKV